MFSPIRFIQIGIAVYGHLFWWVLVRAGLWHSHLTPAQKFSRMLEKLGTPFVKLGQGLSRHTELVRDAPGDCPICGMALVPIAGTGAGQADDSELRDLARRLWVGVALSIPLVVLAMSPMIGIHDLFGLQPRPRGWIEFVLGTPVVLWVGWPILRKFWFSLVHRALNIYTLIGLGGRAGLPVQPHRSFFPGLFPQEFREHDSAVGTYFEAAAVSQREPWPAA